MSETGSQGSILLAFDKQTQQEVVAKIFDIRTRMECWKQQKYLHQVAVMVFGNSLMKKYEIDLITVSKTVLN